MKKRRRKIRRHRTATLPKPPQPNVNSVSILRELNESFISPDAPMSEHTRRAFQAALHDQVGKTRLHLSAVALHRQKRQVKLAAMADFILHFVSNPEYFKTALKDPDTAIKLLSLIHKIDVEDTKFLYDFAIGTRKKEDQGWDAKKSLDLVTGVGGANPNNLPPELQDPRRLRQFRDKAQLLFDLLSGEEMPQPPDVPDRVVRAHKAEGKNGES